MGSLTEFVELDKKLHDRASFDCGKKELNVFIKTQASKHSINGVSKTYVLPGIRNPGNGTRPICAFYTLSPVSIDRESLPTENKKKLPHYPVPAILIGQLAVNDSDKGKGLGAITLIKALKFAQTISEKIGGVAVIVDCLDKDAEQFYLKYGFQELGNVNGKTRLFLPMATIKMIP